ncbi:hypothetical protein T4B_9212 [Trichinella pseudospiralis]|uniref:Uncharacterized protein n=1 Tax=Trichinella pseudospiralis TaxID=6337 RepID=A0A0V1JF69_TRIPS|nr:hypothetical protein T4A_11791 [Trichinella pseudospiralis]KRZ28064.1 hypothetical protein T4B_9212 [Trichinella pseudospiralis]KRZ33650.1 hypothetical protein T4C_1236 [Trichinella pseudospiralis]
MSNVDKWLVQVERPLQLSVSDELVKKRARLLALWFCCPPPPLPQSEPGHTKSSNLYCVTLKL